MYRCAQILGVMLPGEINVQMCTNSGCHVAWRNKFCMVVPIRPCNSGDKGLNNVKDFPHHPNSVNL